MNATVKTILQFNRELIDATATRNGQDFLVDTSASLEEF